MEASADPADYLFGSGGDRRTLLRNTPQNAKLIIRHSRNLSVREFQEGNFILFGSQPNDVWTDLFNSRLNLRTTRLSTEQACFENRKPEPGESRLYCTEGPASVNSGIGYARVAYLPNLSGNGYVLLIAGLNMVTSEAAGQYVVSPALGADLRKLLRIGSYSDLPYVEVLLRTSAVDTTPSAVKVVARREIK